MSGITEGIVEEACLEYLAALGYHTAYGPNLGPEGAFAERTSWVDVVLVGRLRTAVARLNPSLPTDAVDAVIATVLRAESQNAMEENYRVHRLVTQGVPVEYRAEDNSIRHGLAWLVDFDDPLNNDLLALNQFTVVEDGHNRRPDVVIFVNGLALGLLELKNPGDENATLRGAWNQIQTYKTDIPSMFLANAVCVASDGISAVMGSFSAPWEHYAPWKAIDSPDVVTTGSQLEVLIRGAFEPARFLDLVRSFVVFVDDPDRLAKLVAKYHQYWAVNLAVASAIVASGPDGDRRGGVVWHTQGSGKSLEMLWFAAKAMVAPELTNPTLVFIVDRNDLDDQLFGETFAPSRLLPEEPVQATSRAHLRQLLDRQSGGFVFTTLQKFSPDEKGDIHPLLTDRRNVLVIADEAHRSQYDFIDGYARHLRDALPNATYLGFTGTPMDEADKSTQAVFGDYVDIYDLTRAVEDGATVKIYYQSRLAKIRLPDDVREELDEEIAQLTEGTELTEAERAKTRWARLEAVVGADERLGIIAADIVEHWEKRRASLIGKAMVVCMSRRICVALYDRIVALRPDWHSDDINDGRIKVVMTGSAADPPEFQRHLHSKQDQRTLKARCKKVDDPLELVLVCDMWLTGFDAPPMHTMYVDKAMQGVGLMQAIARVNRTFRDKPGGLIVDYIGIAQNLRKALASYSPSDKGQAGVPLEDVINVVREKHDIVSTILHDLNWDSDPELAAPQRMDQLAAAVDFVLADPDRKVRFSDQTLALVKAFSLAGGADEVMPFRDDVRFFADIRSSIVKLDKEGEPGEGGRGGSGEVDTAIAQLVSEAVAADEVIDVYSAIGMDTPDISILSDEFLESLTKAERPNLQMQMLTRILKDQIRASRRENVVQARQFSAMLDATISRYTNRNLSTAEIIAELVALARLMRDDKDRAAAMGLTNDEVAFYDAIVQNDAAVLELGDDTLKMLAHKLVEAVRESASIDWNLKESVRAGMRAKIKRLLTRYDYPPDKEEQAIQLVLEQAEALTEGVVSGRASREDDGGLGSGAVDQAVVTVELDTGVSLELLDLIREEFAKQGLSIASIEETPSLGDFFDAPGDGPMSSMRVPTSFGTMLMFVVEEGADFAKGAVFAAAVKMAWESVCKRSSSLEKVDAKVRSRRKP